VPPFLMARIRQIHWQIPLDNHLIAGLHLDHYIQLVCEYVSQLS
jgi:hypothetical protein